MNATSPMFPVVVAALVAAPAGAAVTTYPGLNATLTSPSQTATNLAHGPVTLDASTGQFIDPNDGSADPSLTRYIGGTLTYTPNSNEWGSGGHLRLVRSDGNETLRFGKDEGGTAWTLVGNSSTFNTGITASGAVDFVLRIRDVAWNVAAIDLFLGANANAATEGTPDGTVQLINATSTSFIQDLKLTFTTQNWATGESGITLANAFSADVWTPVGSIVPEPASVALLGFGAVLALRRRPA